MKEFDCRTAGSPCKGAVTASDDTDLEQKISGHLREVHEIEPNETIMTYLLSTAREKGSSS
jgi:Protein of unknown function (DUF1059).